MRGGYSRYTTGRTKGMSEAAAISAATCTPQYPLPPEKGDKSPGDQPCVPLQLVVSGDNVRSALQQCALLRMLLVPLRTRT